MALRSALVAGAVGLGPGIRSRNRSGRAIALLPPGPGKTDLPLINPMAPTSSVEPFLNAGAVGTLYDRYIYTYCGKVIDKYLNFPHS